MYSTQVWSLSALCSHWHLASRTLADAASSSRARREEAIKYSLRATRVDIIEKKATSGGIYYTTALFERPSGTDCLQAGIN